MVVKVGAQLHHIKLRDLIQSELRPCSHQSEHHVVPRTLEKALTVGPF
jgi:hypothetical protein